MLRIPQVHGQSLFPAPADLVQTAALSRILSDQWHLNSTPSYTQPDPADTRTNTRYAHGTLSRNAPSIPRVQYHHPFPESPYDAPTMETVPEWWQSLHVVHTAVPLHPTSGTHPPIPVILQYGQNGHA
ncbi:hypothetical protein D3C74_331760 [compost metagenome]